MTVREFSGTGDDLVCTVGAASDLTHGAVASLVKFNTVTDFRHWGSLHSSGNAFRSNPLGLTNFTWLETVYGSSVHYGSGSAMSTGVWVLLVQRKASGVVTGRLSIRNMSTGAWTHHPASGDLGNGTAPGAGGLIRFSFQGSSAFFGGRIAARAFWSNEVPWADDAAVQAAGLHTAASNWLAADPAVFHLFNQSSVGTPVEDLSTGGGGDQVSISGTTVITDDDPPGFNFTLDATIPYGRLVIGQGRSSGLTLAQAGAQTLALKGQQAPKLELT